MSSFACVLEQPESLPAPIEKFASVNAIRLAAGEVVVWRMDVERWAASELVELAYAALTEAERARAESFRRALIRAEFIAGRGCLRILLAAFAGNAFEPKAIPLESGQYGKPQVAAAFARQFGLPSFSVAHSHGQVLLAFSRAGAVGVDLEYLDHAIEPMEIAQHSFAPAEVAFLDSARTERERLLAFYACWTRKEALAKADGRGLTLAIQEIPVFAQPGECSVRLGQPDAAGDGRYRVREIEAGAKFLAALATAKSPAAVRVEVLDAETLRDAAESLAACELAHPLVAGNPGYSTSRAEVLNRWGMNSGSFSHTLNS